MPIDPNVRVSEPVEPAAAAGGQPVAMELNTDQFDERDGRASCQLDENQLPTMDVSLERGHNNCCTIAYKQC